MSWTALIAEYLIIGAQASFWLTLLAFRFNQDSFRQAVVWAERSPVASSALLVAVAIAFAYPLGMLLDTLLFRAMQRLVGRSRAMKIWDSSLNRKNSEDLSKFARRFYGAEARMYGSEGRLGRLYRRRSRLRIFRASLVNMPLATLLLAFYTEFWLLVPFGLGFALATLYAFFVVYDQYHRMVKSEEKLFKSQDRDGSSEAAANTSLERTTPKSRPVKNTGASRDG